MQECFFNVYSFGRDESFYRGDCFENALLEELENSKEYDADNESNKLLFKEIENGNKRCHPQDLLDELFRKNVFIDYDFAKTLNLYDVLSAKCFESNNKIGKAIIKLMDWVGFKFILYSKEFYDKESFTFDFDVCHTDFVNKMRMKHITGEFIE